MTNFERMKSMTQEEMAHELALIASWDRKEYKKAINTIGLENCSCNKADNVCKGCENRCSLTFKEK